MDLGRYDHICPLDGMWNHQKVILVQKIVLNKFDL